VLTKDTFLVFFCHGVTVGEVGLRNHHPRSATPATFGLRTVSVSWGSLRRTGADETLMPLCHVSFVVQE
jgi:hypothetical protein